MIDGIWWLVILLGVILGLWLLGIARGRTAAQSNSYAKTNTKTSTTGHKVNVPHNRALARTMQRLHKACPDYTAVQKNSHILLSHEGKRIAIITIDQQLAIGERRLGDVPIFNYHRVPSCEVLTRQLRRTHL